MAQEVPEKPTFDLEAVFEVDDYLYFYSHVLTEEITERQIAFLVRELALQPPMQILDLACGFGRHANRLAAMGYDVVGVDYMPGFLDLARQDAQARHVQVDYRQGDMRFLEYDQEFDRVLLMFTSFGYFEDQANLQTMTNIARSLKPGGLLVFDTHNRDVFLKGFLPYIVTEKGSDLMIDRNVFDTATGRLYNRRIVIRNGVRKDKPFFVRMYNPNEIADVLHQAGLEIVRMFGGWDSQPISSDSRQMIVLARKPER